MAGFTLIELMVGMVVGLIVVMTMLSLYKTASKSTAEAGYGAIMDGQIAGGIIMADRLLQSAGYGYASGSNAYGSTLQVYLASSTVSTGTAGNALVWKSGATTCQALVANGNNLIFYGPASSGYTCSSGLALPASSNASQGIITSVPVTLPNAPAAGSATIVISNAICTPFGTGTAVSSAVIASGGYVATLTIQGYAASASIQNQTCLTNFH
ncbi:PilW family protein [Aquitalea magnusonii]|uniref:PilW family protein n=1 Tax=Aquitalea magnusonii TaxID=332411 RepID=UPI00195A721E|nr:prepilin-type N-terminal cleavage/methylation domain-containing protein [Aquitalea magnusonii]